MRGSIRKRGAGVYQLVIEAPAGPNGERRQTYETVRGTRKQATDRLNELLAQRGAGPLAKSPTIGHLCDRHLELASLAATTRAQAKRSRDRLPDWLCSMRAAAVTPDDITRAYRELERDGVSVHQIRWVHIFLSSALNRAVRSRTLHWNPASLAEPPKVQRRAIIPPDPSDTARLLRAAGPDLRVALVLAATTGMRRGEVCGLRWDDVDLLAGTVTVRRSVAYTPESGVVVKNTKTDRARVVPIGPASQQVLADWYATVAQIREPAGFVLSLAFDGREPWRPDLYTHRFVRLRNKLGLKVRLHDLRHAAATTMISGGTDVRTVAGILGHSRASTTSDIYAAWVPSAARSAIEGMEGALGLDGG